MSNEPLITSLESILEQLPKERRERIEQRSDRLLAQELTLKELRQSLGLTQAEMADLLDIGQDSVSRLERRDDLLLSSLQNYIAAAGGQLRLIAEFPDRPAVDLSILTDARK
ncbi:MAG: helix-turn-helix domain-containing protein [Cyanobacteria bacterium J06597_1]